MDESRSRAKRMAEVASKTLSFEGHSDDTFGYDVNGKPCDDYDNCASGKPIRWAITRNGGAGAPVGMVVVGQYALDGSSTWLIGVTGLHDTGDDILWPDWPIRIDAPTDGKYTPRLTIIVPADAAVTCLERVKEDGDDHG